jgi:CBS domain containing-hemolysin-like protein
MVGYLAQPSIGRLLSVPLGTFLPATSVESVSTGVALVLVTLFSMVFGELVPQFLGISAPLATAKVVALPVRAFSAAAKPLIVLLNGSANGFLRGMGIEPQEELSGARTPQELASLVRRSAEAGTMELTTAERVTRTLDFGDRTAADVMTSRVRATSIERRATATDVAELARRTGHSRFPVVGEDWDDVDGIVHVKRALAVPPERRDLVPVSALMVDHVMVPETIRLDALLGQLRESGLQMAVVVDEYGGTAGGGHPGGRRRGDRRGHRRRARLVGGHRPPRQGRIVVGPGHVASRRGADPAGRSGAGPPGIRDGRWVSHGGPGAGARAR